MNDTMFSMTPDWNEQYINILFCTESDGDDNPSLSVTLSREEAIGVAKLMLEYARHLALTEDEYWEEEVNEL